MAACRTRRQGWSKQRGALGFCFRLAYYAVVFAVGGIMVALLYLVSLLG